MKNHEYSKNTKTTYHDIDARLLKKGFSMFQYGDNIDGTAHAYYQKGIETIRVDYYWIPNPAGRGVIAGKAISIESY